MFGIGMNEMLLLLVLGVIIIGPKQIPEVARMLGKFYTQFKRATNDLRDAVNDEVSQHQEAAELKKIQSEMYDFRHHAKEFLESTLEEETEEVKSISRDVNLAAKEAENSIKNPLADDHSTDFGEDMQEDAETDTETDDTMADYAPYSNQETSTSADSPQTVKKNKKEKTA